MGEKVFLLISAALAKAVVPDLMEHQEVQVVVYGVEKQEHFERFTFENKKIKAVYSEFEMALNATKAILDTVQKI